MTRRRTLRRATLVAVALILGTLVASAATWLGGGQVPFASGATWFKVTATAGSDFTPAPGAPVFVLVIGNDARPGVDGARADAIHLIGVNPATRQATVLDIPRDTEVAIPGEGTDKINLANAVGGPRLMAETVSQLVGVPIPYVIETNFDGFIALVNDMGGLEVNVPEAMDDDASGAKFAAGPQRLNGEQALAYSRNRKQFPTGDLKRTKNQGYLIISALAQLRAQNTGPVGTLRALAILGRHTTIDGIGLRDLYDLGRLGLSVDPANLRNVVIPVTSGSGSNLEVAASADALFADFADDAVLQTS